MASNPTHSDRGHPFRGVLTLQRLGQATIWGQTKIVEESDDSRITTTRTFVCHLHSISSFSDSYILKSVYGMPLSKLYTGTHTSQMFVSISLSTLSIEINEIAIVHMTLHLEWRRSRWA